MSKLTIEKIEQEEVKEDQEEEVTVDHEEEVKEEEVWKKITGYEAQLATLNTRMELLLQRYNKQFSAMEALVGKSKSMQTSLTSTFEGMMNAYKK